MEKALESIAPAQLAESNAIIAAWISYIDASPKTIESYTRSIRQYARFLAENGITMPDRRTIIAYREHLAQHHSPATVQAYLAAVKQLYRFAEQEGLYTNIAGHVKSPRIDQGHKKDYLTANQAGQLLAAIERDSERGKRDYAIIILMLTTGLRDIEVCRANVGDMRPLGGCAVLHVQGKGHDDRNDFVKVTDRAERAIREYLLIRGASNSLEEPLFASVANRNTGGRLTQRSISRMVKSRLEDVGIISDRVTAHSLRHTAATLNLLNGGTLEETQQLLRHTNINTTMIYAHDLERMANDSENRISKALFG